jgi:hypothetical protein
LEVGTAHLSVKERGDMKMTTLKSESRLALALRVALAGLGALPQEATAKAA